MVRRLLVIPLLVCASVAPAQHTPVSHEVSYKNVSFAFESSLAKRYTVETVPESQESSKTPEGPPAAPEHLLFTLRESYVRDRDNVPDLEALPRIRVLPLAGAADEHFALSYPALKETVDELRQLLGKRTTMGKIPVFPGDGAKEQFVARKKSMRFRNGRGIGFVTQFAGPNEPPANDRLVYVFVGLTDDFKWFVSMIFPVEAPGLPGHARDVVLEQSLESYVHDMIDRLERLQPRTFYPTLMSMENVIRSLKVASP
jgi:hypothetical protein